MEIIEKMTGKLAQIFENHDTFLGKKSRTAEIEFFLCRQHGNKRW